MEVCCALSRSQEGSLPRVAGHGVLVKDTNYSPAGPQSLWTLADRHAFRRTLLEDAAAQPEQGSDKYGLKEAAIVVEASEEDEEDKEESEEAIKARKNSPPLLGSEINLKEEAEINGTDAFVEWAAQFGPNGTGFAGTNRVRYPATLDLLLLCAPSYMACARHECNPPLAVLVRMLQCP